MEQIKLLYSIKIQVSGFRLLTPMFKDLIDIPQITLFTLNICQCLLKIKEITIEAIYSSLIC